MSSYKRLLSKLGLDKPVDTSTITESRTLPERFNKSIEHICDEYGQPELYKEICQKVRGSDNYILHESDHVKFSYIHINFALPLLCNAIDSNNEKTV